MNSTIEAAGKQVADSKFLRDRFNVCRRKLDELLTVKLAPSGRKGLVADETQGKRRHGWLQNAGPSMYRLGPWPGQGPPCTCAIEREPGETPRVQTKRTDLRETYDHP